MDHLCQPFDHRSENHAFIRTAHAWVHAMHAHHEAPPLPWYMVAHHQLIILGSCLTPHIFPKSHRQSHPKLPSLESVASAPHPQGFHNLSFNCQDDESVSPSSQHRHHQRHHSADHCDDAAEPFTTSRRTGRSSTLTSSEEISEGPRTRSRSCEAPLRRPTNTDFPMDLPFMRSISINQAQQADPTGEILKSAAESMDPDEFYNHVLEMFRFQGNGRSLSVPY